MVEHLAAALPSSYVQRLSIEFNNFPSNSNPNPEIVYAKLIGTVQTLSLRGNKIGDDAAKAIFNAVAENKAILVCSLRVPTFQILTYMYARVCVCVCVCV